jgi:Aldose 1-epimerase
MEPLSGSQIRLSAGDYRATIASVGASLRELTWQGGHRVVPFDADEVRPNYRGAVLTPWPNRVVDGRYQFDGVEHQLALTEPERGHALHGLAVWQDFAEVSQDPSAAALGTTVPAQAGYPFPLGFGRHLLDRIRRESPCRAAGRPPPWPAPRPAARAPRSQRRRHATTPRRTPPALPGEVPDWSVRSDRSRPGRRRSCTTGSRSSRRRRAGRSRCP